MPGTSCQVGGAAHGRLQGFSFKMQVANEAQSNLSGLGKRRPQGPARHELAQISKKRPKQCIVHH